MSQWKRRSETGTPPAGDKRRYGSRGPGGPRPGSAPGLQAAREIRVAAYPDVQPEVGCVLISAAGVCSGETLTCVRTVARVPYTGRMATVFQVR
jgi:hypothetical protein